MVLTPGLLRKASGGGAASGSKSEPMFDSGDADHVLHAEETWENISAASQIGTFTRSDGGPAFEDAGASAYGTVVAEADPFGSVKHLSLDYHSDPPIPPHGTGAHAAGDHWPGAETGSFQGDATGAVHGGISGAVNRGFEINSFLNSAQQGDSIVYEFAVRNRGTNPYEGKALDINAGQGSGVGRFNEESFGSNLGVGGQFNCVDGQICQVYYADAGQTPLASGLPPKYNSYVPSFSRSQTAGELTAAMGGSGTVCYYKMNRNWGPNAGQFAWGSGNAAGWGQNDSDVTTPNADLTGTGKRMIEAGWLYKKIRITKEPDESPYHFGRGRIEMWLGSPASSTGPGAMVKVLEWFGDVGEEWEDKVWVAPTYADQLLGNVHVYSLSAQVYRGGAIVDIGFLRVWSHSRISL